MLIQEDVCRFVVNQTLGGRDVVNILDYQIDTTGSTLSREDAIQQQAEIILQEWSDSFGGIQVEELGYESVSWVDLDSPTGSTGTVTEGSGAASWPATGESVGSPFSANVAILVHKNIVASRTTRNGRMYLAGLPEEITSVDNGNIVVPAEVTSINALLASFLGDTNQSTPGPDEFQSAMVVVHTVSEDNPTPPPAKIVEAVGYSAVLTLTCDNLVATQRRRLRG